MVVVEGGGVAMQQQQELAAQKEELGQPAVEGHQQDLLAEVRADNAGVRRIGTYGLNFNCIVESVHTTSVAYLYPRLSNSNLNTAHFPEF